MKSLTSVWKWLIQIALLATCYGYCNIEPSDFTCLKDLYYATSGATWTSPWPLQTNQSACAWYGVTCSVVSSQCRVVEISLVANNLAGTIPMSLGNLSQLTTLKLSNNLLRGTIPPTLGNLSLLSSLQLDLNSLTGTIPSSLGSLNQLLDLYLYQNSLTGTLPSSFAGLSNIESLFLSHNHLSGPVLTWIEALSNLVAMGLFNNQLTGALPQNWTSFKRLTTLELDSNLFSQSIPDSLGEVYHLRTLYLNDNRFSGTIPSSLGNLFLMRFMYLNNNQLNGSIPSTFGTLTTLLTLFLSENQLTGTIPMAFSSLPLLRNLLLNSNYFHGEALVYAPKLTYLDVSANAFTGSLSANLWNISVGELFLDSNTFTGSFPAREERLCRLRFVSVADNLLTGRLPADLALCTNMTAFFASDMQLTGPIMGLFATQPYLQTLVIANNSLTGGIDDVFAAAIAMNGNAEAGGFILNAAYNQLSGSLPVTSLSSGRYQSLILNANCFSGTLPGAALCRNRNASELLLSGLHTATSCRSKPFAFLSVLGVYASYLETTAFGGSLPACLFTDLPALTFLALSGNQLTGTIPTTFASSLTSLTTSTTLQGLDLSHNMLTGTIPAEIFHFANLTLLDLSFNRLAGTIVASAQWPPSARTATSTTSTTTNTSASSQTAKLALEVNRLSGRLPVGWVEAMNVQVLDGNLFACATNSLTHTANVPIHDPSASTYACGSSTTNVALLAMLVSLVTLIGIGSGCGGLVTVSPTWQHLGWSLWGVVMGIVEGPPHGGGELRRWLGVAMSILVLSMALYAGLTVTTSAYTMTYVWAVALALQEGVMAGSLLLVWLAAITGVLLWGVRLSLSSSVSSSKGDEISSPSPVANSESDNADDDNDDNSLSAASTSTSTMTRSKPWTTGASSWLNRGPQMAFCVALCLIHTLPVVIVNLLYVYTTTRPLSRTVQGTVAAMVAGFKLAWNALLNVALTQPDAPWRTWLQRYGVHTTLLTALLLGVGLFNLILAPLVTEALASPNCFQYVFTAIPTDTYNVQGGTCYLINYATATEASVTAVECMSYTELLATFDSGSPATGGNYNLNVLSTTSNGEASVVDFQAGFTYNYQCTFSLLQAFVYVFVVKYLMRIVVMPTVWVLLKHGQTKSGWWWRWLGTHTTSVGRLLPTLLQLIDDDRGDDSNGYRIDSGPVAMANEDMEANRQRLKRWQRQQQATRTATLLMLRIVMDGAVALSFGLLFPPLGLLAIVGIVVDVGTTRWMVTRIRRHARWAQRQWPSSSSSITVSSSETGTTLSTAALQGQEYAALLSQTVAELDTALADHAIWRLVSTALPRTTVVAAVLWSLALFDVVGRRVGAARAVAVLVVTWTMPWWMVLLVDPTWWKRLRLGAQSSIPDDVTTTEAKGNGDVEMVDNPLTAAEIPRG